jgi:hypothetical protein
LDQDVLGAAFDGQAQGGGADGGADGQFLAFP